MNNTKHLSPESAGKYLTQLNNALQAAHASDNVSLNSVVWPAGLDRSILHLLPINVRTYNCVKQAKLTSGDASLKAHEVLKLPNFGRNSLNDLLFSLEMFLNGYLVKNIGNNDNTKQTEDEFTKHLSPESAGKQLAQLNNALQAVHAGEDVSLSSVVWPAGLDRSILHLLPINVRTYNCVRQAKMTSGDASLKAYEMLSLPNFGRNSLNDLLVSLERFLIEYLIENTGNIDTYKQTEDEYQSDCWNLVGQNIKPLLASSVDLLGKQTFADLLNPDLVNLASKMGLVPTLQSIKIRDVAGETPSISEIIVRRLRNILVTAERTQKIIIQERLIQEPPTTLEKIGDNLGITRERVRQIQTNLERKIEVTVGEELKILATTLHEQLGSVIKVSILDNHIDNIVSSKSYPVKRLFRRALLQAMGLTLNNGAYTDKHAKKIICNLKSSAKTLADDVGLVEEYKLLETLPDRNWQQFWPYLLEECEIHEFHEMLALKDTKQARVKAALMSIGHPATQEEIGYVCRYDVNRVRSTLTNISSVVRVDKKRWGLSEWVDNEYDGITEEIIRRIKRDGGVTTIDRLLTDIPQKCNVKPQSVRTYMQAPRFKIQSNMISLANVESIQLRPLDDVISGRDKNGAPYWDFIVDRRYFEGYSVLGIPPEFAKELGCNPDSSLPVRIENFTNCRELSLRWNLSSITGASLGYVAEPLRQLGLHPGDHARVTIKGKCSVELSSEDNHSQTFQFEDAEEILKRILGRRKV